MVKTRVSAPIIIIIKMIATTVTTETAITKNNDNNRYRHINTITIIITITITNTNIKLIIRRKTTCYRFYFLNKVTIKAFRAKNIDYLFSYLLLSYFFTTI